MDDIQPTNTIRVHCPLCGKPLAIVITLDSVRTWLAREGETWVEPAVKAVSATHECIDPSRDRSR